MIRSDPENVVSPPIKSPETLPYKTSIKVWTIREFGNMSVREMNNSGNQVTASNNDATLREVFNNSSNQQN